MIVYTNRPKIHVQCPECGSTNITMNHPNFGPMWCNDCKYRVESKEQDLYILMHDGGTTSFKNKEEE